MVRRRSKAVLPPPPEDDPVEDLDGPVSNNALSGHIWNEATRAANSLFASAVRAFTESRMRQNPSYAADIMASHNRISEAHGYGWNKIDPKWAALCGGRGGDGRTRAERLEAEREFSRFLYDYNTTVMGIIETLVTYVCGQELNISFSLGNTKKAKVESAIVKRARDRWMEMYRRDGFQFEVRAAELVRRTLRDGEALNHIFLRDTPKRLPNFTEATAKVKKEAVWRFGEPEDLKVPVHSGVTKPNIDFGVEYDPDDPELALRYWFAPPGATKSKDVPGNEIYHVKIGACLNAHRGVPLIRGQLADRCKQYGEWLDTRIFLNKARASIAAVVYRNSAVTNDKSALESVQTRKKLKNLPGGGTKEIQKYVLDVATIMFMKQGEKLEFISPNLGADEAVKDGRSILCSISVALGLSDYMITGDSEYGKYANQEVGESRGIATLVGYQRFFLRHIAWIVKQLVSLELAAEGASVEQLDELEVTVLGPRIVPRDLLAWARAQDLKLKNRTTSRHQVIRDDSLDPDLIDEEINQDTMEVPSDMMDDPSTAGVVQRKNLNNRPKTSPTKSPSTSSKKD